MIHPKLAICSLLLLAIGCKGGDSVEPSPATRLGLVAQPSGQAQNGTPLAVQPVVQLQDNQGASVDQADVPVTVSIATGGGRLIGTTTVNTSSSGQASFTGLALGGTVGPRTLVFAAPDLAPVTSGTIDLAAGPAVAIGLAGGNQQTAAAGSALATPLAVALTDADNNPVPGVPVTFEVSSGGGSVVPSSATADAAGVAQTTWTLGPNPGENQARAVATGLTGSPVLFTATGTQPVRTIVPVSGNNQSGLPGSQLANPIVVKVSDAQNNPVSGVQVSFAVSSGGGSVSLQSVTTDAAGLAQTTWTLGPAAGENRLRAEASGAIGSPVLFTATGTQVPPTIASQSGNGQSGVPASQLTNPIVVKVTNSQNNPVSGIQVNFQVSLGGGSVSPGSATTNASGFAQTTWTLGPAPGENRVRAEAPGVTGSPVLFTATATPPPAGLEIAGGTYVDRDAGLVGTSFVFNPRPAAGLISSVTITGPPSWNGGSPHRCAADRPPGTAASVAICLPNTIPAVSGEYTAEASVGGEVLVSSFSIDATERLDAPRITGVGATASRVAINWTAPAAARSFLVRVNPIPFTGVITAEKIVGGDQSQTVFEGLSLTAGGQYQAVVWAFTENVGAAIDIGSQFNASVHGLAFRLAAPGGLFSASAVVSSGGFTSLPSDLFRVEPTATGSDILVGRVRTATAELVLTDLALSPDGSSLYAISFTTLYLLNREDGSAIEVGRMGFSGVNALAFDGLGTLYAAGGSDGSFYRVDAVTGVATRLGSYGSGLGSSGDIVFAPDGTLLGVATRGGTDILVTINKADGQATPIGTGLGSDRFWGLAYHEGVLYGLTSTTAAGPGNLVTIDPSSGTATLVRPLSFDAQGGLRARR